MRWGIAAWPPGGAGRLCAEKLASGVVVATARYAAPASGWTLSAVRSAEAMRGSAERQQRQLWPSSPQWSVVGALRQQLGASVGVD